MCDGLAILGYLHTADAAALISDREGDLMLLLPAVVVAGLANVRVCFVYAIHCDLCLRLVARLVGDNDRIFAVLGDVQDIVALAQTHLNARRSHLGDAAAVSIVGFQHNLGTGHIFIVADRRLLDNRRGAVDATDNYGSVRRLARFVDRSDGVAAVLGNGEQIAAVRLQRSCVEVLVGDRGDFRSAVVMDSHADGGVGGIDLRLLRCNSRCNVAFNSFDRNLHLCAAALAVLCGDRIGSVFGNGQGIAAAAAGKLTLVTGHLDLCCIAVCIGNFNWNGNVGGSFIDLLVSCLQGRLLFGSCYNNICACLIFCFIGGNDGVFAWLYVFHTTTVYFVLAGCF